MKTTWQPIETAPTDSRVILTDSGLVKWDTAGKCESPRPPKWERCFFNGCLDLDSFNEDYPRPDVAPKYWLPVEIPPLPAK